MWNQLINHRINLAQAVTLALAGLAMTTAVAQGADTTYIASENANSFGHFDQNATDTTVAPNGTTSNFLITPNNPGVSAMGPAACAPTSAANSFIYLQNQYGLTGLVNLGNPYGTISTLAANMNTAPATSVGGSQTNYTGGGTTDGNFVQGKEAYLQNLAPGGFTAPNGQKYAIQTVGQSAFYSQAASGPWKGGVTQTAPTAQFIEQQLAAGEDVEMGISWSNGSGGYSGAGGHMVALTGINYDATTNSGTVSFVDPTNNSGGNITYGTGDAPNITSSSLEMITSGTYNGYLKFSYTGGASGIAADDNSGASTTALIDGVFAESPVLVPEPTGLVLLAVAGLGVLMLRKRRSA